MGMGPEKGVFLRGPGGGALGTPPPDLAPRGVWGSEVTN